MHVLHSDRAHRYGRGCWALRCTTLRGDTLAFGWEGPLTVNGEEQPLSGYKHYENPYCTAELPVSEMEVRTANFL